MRVEGEMYIMMELVKCKNTCGIFLAFFIEQKSFLTPFFQCLTHFHTLHFSVAFPFSFLFYNTTMIASRLYLEQVWSMTSSPSQQPTKVL